MRRLAIALLAILAAGCGGSGGKPVAETTVPERTRDPGREVMAALVDAARESDAAAMWALLSGPTRRRVGPTEEVFANGAARSLARRLRPFTDGYRVIVSERITDLFGVVAVAHGTSAHAVPMRLEGGVWRVELQGPLTIDVLGPDPGATEKVVQIGVEVRGPVGGGDSVLYVDGISLITKGAGGPTSATVFANLSSPLEPGRHSAVAFAAGARDAAAVAWTFTAR